MLTDLTPNHILTYMYLNSICKVCFTGCDLLLSLLPFFRE